ncbi:hypothetical protein SH528x_004752 [Novipirellula sp. SH528]|uniref:hypothetical protein n=1 Tax=Novipirellula sp. SH528 TaxID=3454466 RepID=UPI003FA05441
MNSFGMPGVAEIVIIMLIIGILVLPLVLVIGIVFYIKKINENAKPTYSQPSLNCPSCDVAIQAPSAFCPHCGATLKPTDDR